MRRHFVREQSKRAGSRLGLVLAYNMQQSGIKRFFSQSAAKTPGSSAGNGARQGPDATPSQKPAKRPRATDNDTDENNSSANIRQIAQVCTALGIELDEL